MQLTPIERERAMSWTAAHRPELINYPNRPRKAFSSPTRVEVVRGEPERPLTAVTHEQLAERAVQCGGVAGIGPSLEEKRRERIARVRMFVLLWLAGAFALVLMFWATGILVRSFWTP